MPLEEVSDPQRARDPIRAPLQEQESPSDMRPLQRDQVLILVTYVQDPIQGPYAGAARPDDSRRGELQARQAQAVLAELGGSRQLQRAAGEEGEADEYGEEASQAGIHFVSGDIARAAVESGRAAIAELQVRDGFGPPIAD